MRSRSRKYQGVTLLIIGLFIAGILYCGAKWYQTRYGNTSSSEKDRTAGQESSDTMTGVIKAIDTKGDTITISDINQPLDTNFTYVDGTEFVNKYDEQVSVKKIDLGIIVKIHYNPKTNRLYSVKMAKDSWIYPKVTKMKVDKKNQIIQLGDSNYSYTDDLIILGKEGTISMLDIGDKDQLQVCGVGNNIYSIVVTKGHGYIHFTNYDAFIGGNLSVGNSIYMSVREDMDVVAREGNYTITMTNGELKGSKKVTVARDKEVTVDMGEYTINADRVGKVTFNISPYGADLYINGTQTDYSKPVSLNYGEHKIVVYLSGYKSFTGVLTVGQAEQSIDIELSEDTSREESSASDDVTPTKNSSSNSDNKDLDWNSDSTTSKPSVSPSTAPSPSPSSSSSANTLSIDAAHKITVQEPEGAEVYVDNAYKGVVPVSFTKLLGKHTVVLKKDGYEDKSYSIDVNDDNKDVYYTFKDLVKK